MWQQTEEGPQGRRMRGTDNARHAGWPTRFHQRVMMLRLGGMIHRSDKQ